MNAKLTAAVVGGGSGGKLSMAALRNSTCFDLVAVADINPEVGKVLKQQYPDIRTFTSHEEMFAACPTDVVCVSTYPPSHESITLDALELPLKGILVEKPLGHTAASGRRTLEAVKRAGIPMAVPHGLLVNPAPREIIARVRRGEIGALKLVEIQNTHWDIINAGIHWLNFFVNVTGLEPMDYVMAICESSTRTYRDGMQVETTAVTYGQTVSGIRVVMNTGDDVLVNREGKSTLFRLVGTEGQIEFWGWENAYRLLNSEFPEGTTIVPPELPGTAHQRHLEAMATQIDTGNVDYTIPESSLLALEICEGAYVSSRHRCKVTFPVDEFVPPPSPDWDPGMPYSGWGGGRDGRKL
ncbi:MAG: Gfo/Idh/MocA family protein [Anaerolineae bacterium]